MAAPVFHSLVIDKKAADDLLNASCPCGWSLRHTEADRVTAEYRAHKARAAKETT